MPDPSYKPARKLPWTTYLFLLAQAINLTTAVISVTVAALVGSQLASTPAIGTVPYGVQFAIVMLCTYPASMLMKRHGRRPVFLLGSAALIASGLMGYVAVTQSSFSFLVISHGLLGAFIACANFYRFAAVDELDVALKPRALSLVVAGGVLAAVIGPLLASVLRVQPGHAEFALCYAAFSVLGVLTALMMWWWKPATVTSKTSADAKPPTTSAAASTGRAALPAADSGYRAPVPMIVAAAIFSASAAYFIMNLLMVQSSLVLKGICGFDQVSFAIQAHVLAMFAPSFLTGSLIARFGIRQVLIAGFALLAGAALIGGSHLSYEAVFGGLVVLGLGWNLAYVGGGALLTQSIPESQRHRWQGINDVVIAACATLGAFTPAPLLAFAGWSTSNLLMLPLCIAGAGLCWLALQPKLDRHDDEQHLSDHIRPVSD